MARLVFVPQPCASQTHEVLITHFHEDSGRAGIINTHAQSKGILISSRNLSLLTYEGRLVCLTGCFIGGVVGLITFSVELLLMSHHPRNKISAICFTEWLLHRSVENPALPQTRSLIESTRSAVAM